MLPQLNKVKTLSAYHREQALCLFVSYYVFFHFFNVYFVFCILFLFPFFSSFFLFFLCVRIPNRTVVVNHRIVAMVLRNSALMLFTGNALDDGT